MRRGGKTQDAADGNTREGFALAGKHPARNSFIMPEASLHGSGFFFVKTLKSIGAG
jgi:hypothetical protein